MLSRSVSQGLTSSLLIALLLASGCGGENRKWVSQQAGDGQGGNVGTAATAGSDHSEGGSSATEGGSAGSSTRPMAEAGNEDQTGGHRPTAEGGSTSAAAGRAGAANSGGNGHSAAGQAGSGNAEPGTAGSSNATAGAGHIGPGGAGSGATETGGGGSSAAGSGATTGGAATGGNGSEPTAGAAGTRNDCADGCVIEGDCVADGYTNPDNPCQACDSGQSGDGWTDLTGTPCDDGLYCNGADTCSAGTCEHAGNPCESDVTCRESDDLCCTPAASLVCSGGNVHEVDACGTEGALRETCPGDCNGGACRCVIYLNGDGGSDSNTGLTWGAAKRRLQAAIDAASDAGGCEVWATAATYDVGYLDDPARERVTALKPGVAIYGGFQGFETQRDQRDYGAHVSVITGEPYSATPGDPLDDAYHVVVGADDAVLDGFTITTSNADGDSALERACGGGLLNDGVSPTLRNCIFTANRAKDNGGAICNLNGAAPHIESCAFADNVLTSSSGGIGAAIYSENSSPVIIDSSFTSHTLSRGEGAAIGNRGGSATVVGCTFSDNSARDGGGAAYEADDATSLYSECTFEHNRTGYSGGGALQSYQASPIIVGSYFFDNQGISGGAISFGPGSPYLANSIFRSNHASTSAGGFGGAVESAQSAPTIVNCLFDTNDAVEGAGSWSQAGALGINGGGATITNCTFYNNQAPGTNGQGGAIWMDATTLSTISNSIFSGNVATTAPDIYHPTDGARIAHSVVSGTVDCLVAGTCIAVDPLFVDAAGGDFAPQNSVCIDSADASRLPEDTGDLDHDENRTEPIALDLLGNPRVQGG
ncbi:MAG: hypothetical protein JW940_02885, partial [Polyangiaceae bacterium]|nr:hypothetical protein [Polyangiaceae bacterium]